MKHPLVPVLIAAVLGISAAAGARERQPDFERDIMTPVEPQPQPGGDVVPHVLYLNMAGPTLTFGNNDSRADTSSIIRDAPGGVATFTPFKAQDPAGREALTRCVKLLFGRFGIEVVTEDPGPGVNHIECVVTGAGSGEAFLSSSILGVSPGCSIITNSIVYVFGAFYGNDVQNVCETVGQEVAHSLGLDHEALCEDPMTYDGGCGPKTFQDIDSRCGEHETEPRNCECTASGGATQNSVRVLTSILGPPEAIAPTVTVTAPANNATVSGAVVINTSANDNYIIAKVELYVDGDKVQEDNVPPFDFPLPRNIAPGAHDFRVVALDAANNMGEAALSLTYEAQCSDDSQCDAEAGEICADYYCARPIGGFCDTQDQCEPGLSCGVEEVEQRCTRSCGEGYEGCPGGFECLESFGAGKCWPSEGGGGGCRIGAGHGRAGVGLAGAGFFFLAGVAGLGLLALRRRGRR